MLVISLEECMQLCSKVTITPLADAFEINASIGRSTATGGHNNAQFITRGVNYNIAVQQLINFVNAFCIAADKQQPTEEV